MKNEIMLSVVIISYNQEKYIRDAIDSVINQKTKYKYEILLADDCSSDNTKKILSEYKLKFPKKIKVLPRPHNLGGTANSYDACCCAKGKYICVLEGDDYWCDNNKIQVQVEFLENNPSYIGISHLQRGVDEKNNILGSFPSWVKKDCDVTIDDFLNERLFSETSSIFKNIYLDSSLRKSIEILDGFSREVGDYQKCILLLSEGKIRVIKKDMMVYRAFHNSNNYNSRYKVDEICLEHMDITRKLDDYFKNKYNFFHKYSKYFAMCLSYEIITFNFKHIKETYLLIPAELRWKVVLYYPFLMLKIIFERIMRFFSKRKGDN